jgi:mono/diheme cytochrome c family protein
VGKPFAVVIVLSLALLLTAAAQSLRLEKLPPGGAQVQRGALLYETHCAVCHGKTAFGFAEAREAFPEDHQRCERCHRRGNPAKEADMPVTDRNAFSLGEPPALRGDASLAHFSHALALYGYLRATMPRYQPGRLEDADYLDITAFLLALRGELPDGLELEVEALAPLLIAP